MPKCTGLYGTAERIPSDVHIVFLADHDSQFKSSVDRQAPLFKSTLAALRAKGDFCAKDGDVLALAANEERFVFVGLGTPDKVQLETFRRASARGIKEAAKFVAASVAVHCPPEALSKGRHIVFEDAVQALVEGALLGLYRFDRYVTRDPEAKKGLIKELRFVTADEGLQGRLKIGIETAVTIADGVELARNLTNAPSNEVSPETLAREAAAMAKKLQLKIIVLDKKAIVQHKMGGLLAVNRGSRKEPRFIILEYNETKKRLPQYVIVGKGVTFDSGGLSIKPAASMEEMKMDMAGAAAVLGTMQVVARLKLPIRLVGLIPTTDNMIGGDALCPGDIIRMSNGKTVEVLNTDAEGRLILADALVYAQRYKAEGVIDLATLTGACVVALGSHASGMMGTNADLMERMTLAGEISHERVWQLPLFEEYEKMMKSQVADLKNLGSRWGGAITAAAFLKAFTGEQPWVHIDIAGTAMLEEATEYAPKGGSGVGVRLLTQFFRTLSKH